MHDLIHDLAKSVGGDECKLVGFDGKNIYEKNHHMMSMNLVPWRNQC